MRPFSIRLFSPSGEPGGVLVASRDDWPGRAVVFPRTLAGEVKGRKEYRQPGVYLLLGGNQMYIGEGDPVGDRLDSHVRNKDFWTRGVFFTADGSRLNKAHIQHLESRLIDLATSAARVTLTNARLPTVPALSEEDYAFTENFLAEMLLMLPLLGFWQFTDDSEDGESGAIRQLASPAEAEPAAGGKRGAVYQCLPDGLQFKLSTRGADATLVVSGGGVTVKAGSLVTERVSERFDLDMPSYAAQRRQLRESGVIASCPAGLAFTQDQFFSSGSAAAAVVRGAVSNSDWWKSAEGKTLGDYLRDAKRSNRSSAAQAVTAPSGPA